MGSEREVRGAEVRRANSHLRRAELRRSTHDAGGVRRLASQGSETLQPLRVGGRDDVHEHEAESVAGNVVRRIADGSLQRAEGGSVGTIQRVASPEARLHRSARVDLPMHVEGAIHKGDDLHTPLVRREGAGAGGFAIQDPSLAARIRAPAGGRPLPETVRRTMEHALGRDFAAVRVHEGGQAQADARALGARAFTLGRNIWLGPGESVHDPRLMAHELTHVVQQGKAVTRSSEESTVQRSFGSWLKGLATEALQAGADWVKAKLTGLAEGIPGYRLLCFALRRDPITGDAVERNPRTLAHGVLTLVPRYGEAWYKDLEESGAIERAAEWFGERLDALALSWETIQGLLGQALHEIVSDIAHPTRVLDRLVALFRPPVERILTFVRAVGSKVVELIFEGAMKLAGPSAQRVMAVLRKAKSVIGYVLEHPVDFLRNLIRGVVGGVERFSANFFQHLKDGLRGWLFGTLGKAGIQVPEKLDAKGILSLVMQLTGVTTAKVRAKFEKAVGPEVTKRIRQLEKVAEFARLLFTQDISALVERAREYADNLFERVLGAIKEWALTKIVREAVATIAKLFSPVGAVIQAIQTIYRVIVWLQERIQQIAEVVESALDSIAEIAAGKVDRAAAAIEKTLARTLPPVLSFLAGLVGLGDLSGQIQKVVKSFQETVDKALDKVITYLVTKAKDLFRRGKEAVAKGVAKVKGLLWPSQEFTAKGEKHELWSVERDGKRVAMVASKPLSVRELLNTIRNGEQSEKGKESLGIATKALEALEAAEAHRKPDTEEAKARVLEAATRLSACLQRVFETCKVSLEAGASKTLLEMKQIYAIEGMVGKYSEMAGTKSDRITPDHQPSNKVIKITAGLQDGLGGPLFGGTRVHQIAGTGHSPGGLTINLAHVRHVKTRTYGGGGADVGSNFETRAYDAIKTINEKDLPEERKREDKQDAVLALVHHEMTEDAKVVKRVVTSDKTGPDDPWRDIGELMKDNKDEQTEFISELRGRILQGEERVESQAFGAWKERTGPVPAGRGRKRLERDEGEQDRHDAADPDRHAEKKRKT